MKNATILSAISLCIISLMTTNAQAQQKAGFKLRRAYMESSLVTNFGSTTGGKFGLEAIFDNKWVFSAEIQGGSMDSKNLPKDYQAGTTYLFTVPFSNATPTDEFNSYALNVGRVITKPSDRAWIVAKAGLSYTSIDETQYARNTSPTTVADYGIFGLFIAENSSNYSHTTVKKSTVGLPLALTLHANLSRYVGVLAGIKANINPVRSNIGVEMGLAFGLMRPSRKNMIQPAH